jgi:large subunit ribosomal protein L17
VRHRRRGGKLGRTSAHRLALVRNLVTALLEHERIETTHAKARELRRVADRMITLGKRGSLHARRRALRVIRSPEVAAKVFGDLAERFRDRPGGYTRVVKLRDRVGDAAPVSLVELLDRPEGAKPGKAGAGGKAAAKGGKAKAAKPRAAKSKAEKPKAEKPRAEKSRARSAEAAAKRAGALRKPEGAASKPRGGRRSKSD